jgi:hypothetical protein
MINFLEKHEHSVRNYLRLVVLVGIYTFSIVFALTTIYFTRFSNPYSKYQMLSDNPRDLSNHIQFLSSLTKMNRLEDATFELKHIQLFTKSYPITTKQKAQINALKNQIAQKEKIYTDTLSEYSYWNSVIKENPGYRDAYFMLSRKAYMLFNLRQASLNVNDSLVIDPLFEKGSIVLNKLHEFNKIKSR